MGFEPMIRVLQTLAFPLGHVANLRRNYKISIDLCQSPEKNRLDQPVQMERATGLEPVNLFLGKEAFYQLNYARK